MARINDEMGITQEQIKQLMDNYIFMIETEKQQNSENGMISLVKRDLFGKQIFAVGLLNKGTYINVDTEDVIDEEAFEKIVEKNTTCNATGIYTNNAVSFARRAKMYWNDFDVYRH